LWFVLEPFWGSFWGADWIQSRFKDYTKNNLVWKDITDGNIQNRNIVLLSSDTINSLYERINIDKLINNSKTENIDRILHKWLKCKRVVMMYSVIIFDAWDYPEDLLSDDVIDFKIDFTTGESFTNI
jgi:hypothetical protein